MNLKSILDHLNISKQCKNYGLPLRQCPQFLFLIMGIFIILVSISSFLIGTNYITDPEIVALIVLLLASILLVISFIITKNFEKTAEVSKMKSDFINIVCHQLRSPLTNLKWGFDLLVSEKEKNKPTNEEKELIKNLKDNIERMKELVDNLIFVSRFESEKVPLSKKEVSLEKIVLDLISQFKIYAQELNIKINFESDKNLPLFLGDPVQLKVAIENLIDNALCYSSAGSEIYISLKTEKNNFLFTIKDSGIGIPKKDQKYIFQKFFRAENASDKKTHGSGLGLFITKTIIEKSGGKIWFESEEGKGTIFYFTLPLKSK